jgi:hypothetical protein
MPADAVKDIRPVPSPDTPVMKSVSHGTFGASGPLNAARALVFVSLLLLLLGLIALFFVLFT